jgi:toxin ParE1/3/4
MSHAIWSSEAEHDVEEIALYVAIQDGRPHTAVQIVGEIHELCELIATQPEMGEARSEFCVGCRVFPCKKRWIILYRPTEDGIQVLRVVDGTRDFEKLF